jgi:hypothetical protein
MSASAGAGRAHPRLVDVDAEPGPVQHIDESLVGAHRLACHVLA